MCEQSSFIKLDRNILRWRWYTDENTYRVFLHLLLTANYKDADFQTITVHRGERVTSYGAIAKDLKLSVQNVRTALEHLKSTGEITSKSYSKYQVITILKYDEYQSTNTIDNIQLTGNQQATNNQLTTNKEYNNNKNNKNNITLSISPPSGEMRESKKRFIPPTVDEVKEYCDEKGYEFVDPVSFVSFYESKGWIVGKTKMVSWHSAVSGWNARHKSEIKPERKDPSEDIPRWEELYPEGDLF